MKKLFKKYIHSVLDPEEFSEVTAFLSNEENDKTIYGLMKMAWQQSLEADAGPVIENNRLKTKIAQMIQDEMVMQAQKKLKIYSTLLRIAAVVIIGLLIPAILLFQKSDKPVPVASQTVSIPYGGKTRFVLPDSSAVWLNSGSSLTFPAEFSGIRSVKLDGEAYFKVKKGGMPFIVSTKFGEVEVKGTSFNVKAYPDDPGCQVTLEEGSVIARRPNAGEVTLAPGQQAFFNSGGFRQKAVHTTLFTSWKDGRLIFEKEPLPGVIEKLQRWYNVRIDYHGHELDNLWYTGTIEMESVSEVMEMLSKAAPVKYSFNSKTRVITIKPR